MLYGFYRHKEVIIHFVTQFLSAIFESPGALRRKDRTHERDEKQGNE